MAGGGDEVDQQLISAGRAYKRADEALKKRRAELYERMFTAVRVHGKTKSHVARLVGMTREHLTVLIAEDDRKRAAAEADH